MYVTAVLVTLLGGAARKAWVRKVMWRKNKPLRRGDGDLTELVRIAVRNDKAVYWAESRVCRNGKVVLCVYCKNDVLDMVKVEIDQL